MTVLCATWNVGNAYPPDDLTPWLPLGYDIVAVGVQECLYGPDDECHEDWTQRIKKHFGSDYEEVSNSCITPQASEGITKDQGEYLKDLLEKSKPKQNVFFFCILCFILFLLLYSYLIYLFYQILHQSLAFTFFFYFFFFFFFFQHFTEIDRTCSHKIICSNCSQKFF